MKYNKILSLIAILSIYSTEIILNRPGSSQRSAGSSRSGNKQIGGSTGMQKTNLQDNAGKKGALAVRSQNNQQGPTGDHTAAGAAALSRRNNVMPITQTESSDESSDESAPTEPVVQTALQEPVILDQNNDEIPDSPAAITQEPSVGKMVASVTQQTTPEQVTIAPKESHAVTTPSNQSSEDDILKKLKTLETIETKTDSLLQNSSVDLLFNNFVHLKEFITKNFDKDKMLNLCKELINQIYPTEKEVIQIAPEKAQAQEPSTTPAASTEQSSVETPQPEEQTNTPEQPQESAESSQENTTDDSTAQEPEQESAA